MLQEYTFSCMLSAIFTALSASSPRADVIAYMAVPNVLLKRIIGRYALDHLADMNFLLFSAKL